jgi:cysteine-rich repeat protein
MMVAGRTRRLADVEDGRNTKSRIGRRRSADDFAKVATIAAVLLSFSIVSASSSSAQVSTVDQKCIAAFNKGLRKTSRSHAKIVKRCLTQAAAGRLVEQPEDCIALDPKRKLLRTIVSEADSTGYHCTFGLPSFGVGTNQSGLPRAVLTQFGLLHGTIGPDLNENLLTDPYDSRCQVKVMSTLMKCEDARQKEYLKCQRKGLRDGSIVDGPSLAAECLGSGLSQQPDEKGRIESKCEKAIVRDLVRHCWYTDFSQTFASCGANDLDSTAECLKSESACQLCRMLNDAGGVLRDCDAFDDGDDTNGSCNAECGDGLVHPEESCDDQNLVSGDGCSDVCFEEFGFTCTGEPSVCTSNCGNGAKDTGEDCDDGNSDDGDGCSAQCTVENDFTCTGEPSFCQPSCGDGNLKVDEGEACDDGNAAGGDGCSSTCQIEPGYACSGNPSSCTFVCGNGVFDPGETCDDDDATGGDGCSALCQIESGWMCSGLPSICSPVCGDGLLRSIEGCDDGDLMSGDGCSSLCQVEPGFACAGEPSTCTAICGDGFIRGFETCDDGNTVNGDGCSGTQCRIEFDSFCAGQPSVCFELCGNGQLDGIEQCDDGNRANGDGCNGNCTTQNGYACFGTPSACFPTCGNGVINAGESCDDGNTNPSDGCTPSCQTEPGWLCPTVGAPCDKFDVFIESPLHGSFTTASTQVVTGHYTVLPAGEVSVLVNGVPASSLDQTTRTFSHTVLLSAASVFNPVLVRLVHTPTLQEARDRIVVVRGASVADGAYSPQSVGLRINDRGLDSIEPLVGGLAAGQFDIGTLLPPGSVVTSGCFVDVGFLGCWGSATVRIANPAPSFGKLSLALDSQTNSVFGDINLSNLAIHVNIEGSGLVPNCSLRMTASNLRLAGNFALEPMAGSPSNVDVNLVGDLGASFSGFNTTFTSGLCGAPLIGDIIQALLPDVQALAIDGIGGFLEDPDGSGPEDSPIAAGIEQTLAGISISGPVGEGVGLQLDAPLVAISEDNVGLTLKADAKFQTSIGSGPGQCLPPVGAPDLARSYSPASSFPSFGANSPVLNQPYGIGITISSAGFNQLLRGQTECGLMRASMTSIDVDGAGPVAPLAINSTIFSALIPEFGQLPPLTPLRVDVAPTLAPIVTGEPGPNGELTLLRIAQFDIEIVEPGPETVWLAGTLDLPLGMDLGFDGVGLNIGIGAPEAGDVTIAIVHNPLGVNEIDVETEILPGLVSPLVPSLAGALSGFPLPQFFGLSIDGVEVSRNGQFLSIYADLN